MGKNDASFAGGNGGIERRILQYVDQWFHHVPNFWLMTSSYLSLVLQISSEKVFRPKKNHVKDSLSLGVWSCRVFIFLSPKPFTVAWPPQVSATGMMRIYIDGQLAVSRQGHPPERLPRKRLYVGQSSASQAGHS